MSRQTSSGDVSILDRIIVGIFIGGVTASVTLVVVGMAFSLHYGRLSVMSDATAFIRGHDLTSLMRNLTALMKSGSDILFMTLGILVLVATPMLRVLVSIGYFALERDAKFFFITLFVLAVLITSIMIH